VQACAVHLQPRLADFLNLAAKQLQGQEAKENVSVANNACWAIGEVAVKVKQDISPIVMNIISCLVPILSNSEVCNRVEIIVLGVLVRGVMSVRSHGARDCSQTLCKESLCNVQLIQEIDAKGEVAGFKQVTPGEQCNHPGQTGIGVPRAGGSTHGSLHATLVLCTSHVRIFKEGLRIC
jgi:hypothetical protein